MLIAALEGERMSSKDEGLAVPESDPELGAMLSQGAMSVGLEWTTMSQPPRLDYWLLRVAYAGFQHAAPMNFFPNVLWEVTRL